MSVNFKSLSEEISSRYVEIKSCGANKPGGGGFTAGNTCARGGHTVTDIYGKEHSVTDWPANWGKEAGTYTAYRSGSLESERGIFLAPDKESAQAYAGLHGKVVKEYKVTIANPLVFQNYIDGMATATGKTREQVVSSRDRSGDNKKWLRSADKKIADYAKKHGHDAVVYTRPPLPALREMNFLGKKSNIKET